MKVIEQSVAFDEEVSGYDILTKIERAGRTCYKSEDRIPESRDEQYDSAKRFVGSIIKRGHESVLEHASVTLRFVTDRGVTHELVRHRIAAYSQESTRYCNYGKGGEVTFINPVDFDSWPGIAQQDWLDAMTECEARYLSMLNVGCTPQAARSVLPNSLKTEIVVTMNMRELRHFFKLRTSPAAHPQMRAIAAEALALCQASIPVIFDDLTE